MANKWSLGRACCPSPEPRVRLGLGLDWKALLLAIGVCALATGLALAQAPQHPAKVGILWYLDADLAAPYVGAFKKGMRELGWIEGRTVVFIERYDHGDQNRHPKLAAELVALNVDVLFVADAAVPAARQATDRIPMVCADFFDAILQGITANLARPPSDITGVSWQSVESAIKRLQLTRELIPDARRIGVLYNAASSGAVMEVRGLLAAARNTSVTLIGIEVRSPNDYPSAFARIRTERLDALLVSVDPMTFDARDDIAALASSLRLPVIAEIAEFADAGAILTYGPDLLHSYGRGAYFVDKILKGAKPADLPIEQPTHFQLIVNRNAAKSLGRGVPQSILVNATKVIQ